MRRLRPQPRGRRASTAALTMSGARKASAKVIRIERVNQAARQRSSRYAAALIITSCASLSLKLMIQPFLSSWKPERSEPLTGTSPGSAKAEGAVGPRALTARRLI